MSGLPSVTVVVPLYDSRDTVGELVSSVHATVSDRFATVEFVLVDDACPSGSGAVAAALAAPVGCRIRVLRHSVNCGQQAAIHTGLRRAAGDVVVVMDADLQDEPASIPAMLDELAGSAVPTAVCAGRRGDYQAGHRMRSAVLFRRARNLLSGRRIPPDAGLFCVLPGEALGPVRDLGDPKAHLVSALDRANIPIRSIPALRRPRAAGESSYTSAVRLRAASSALLTLTPAHWIQARRHRRQLAALTVQELTLEELTIDKLNVEEMAGRPAPSAIRTEPE